MNEINSTLIIAEAGVNHNGDINSAKTLIEIAKDAGADAVKFQTWLPGEITGKYAQKAEYMQLPDARESRYEMSCRLALPYAAFRELQQHASRCGIKFLSTPDGFRSLAFLSRDLDIEIIKVGSSEVTHLQFLRKVGCESKPVILSTGISTLGEIETAIATLRAGGASDITLLQCTSEYPAPDNEINLRAIATLKNAFGLKVGFSDHSRGTEASIAAVALGAVVIEKHFTFDVDAAGPDHKASLDPKSLQNMVASIRRVERMLGSPTKRPTPSELKNMAAVRRSVVAAHKIYAGTVLTAEMLTCKRPGGFIEPAQLTSLLGFTISRDLDEDEPIELKDLR